MFNKLFLYKVALGLAFPLSQRYALDPFRVKLYSKFSPTRLVWTAQSRLLEALAIVSYRKTSLPFGQGAQLTRADRGVSLHDTAVTSVQLELLMQALKAVQSLEGDIVEVGAFRGATTVEFACRTKKRVHAVDPFSGYGGCDQDLEQFKRRAIAHSNVHLHREPSGTAAEKFASNSLSFVFIDAVHDVSNSWYDFATWSQRVCRSGIVALHDVDDHPGVRFVAKHVVARSPDFSIWGYCPNLLLLVKC